MTGPFVEVKAWHYFTNDRLWKGRTPDDSSGLASFHKPVPKLLSNGNTFVQHSHGAELVRVPNSVVIFLPFNSVLYSQIALQAKVQRKRPFSRH